MAYRYKRLLALPPWLICAAFGAWPNPPSSLQQSTPTIDVYVYSFDGLPSWVLDGTRAEAARIFRQAAVRINWLDHNSKRHSGSPPLAGGPPELVVRVVPHALPPASKTALAMAFPSAESGGCAFIFYDRVIAMQTTTSLLQTMLGRVVAHEIIHLLLPGQEHSRYGLTRSNWNKDDLRFTSKMSEALSAGLVQLLRERAGQRALPASQTDHTARVSSPRANKPSFVASERPSYSRPE